MSLGHRTSSLQILAVLTLATVAPAQEVRLGMEFQVNSHTTDYQGSPSVGVAADGDFLVVWASDGQDGSGYGVFARRFSSAGSPLASELQVNTYTSDHQRHPSAGVDAGGNFVVTWESTGQDGSGYGIFARRLSSAGSPLASELQVNALTNDNQRFPSVAADADGNFVVAWESLGQDSSGYGVFASRFSSAGSPLASEFQVNVFTTSSQRSPSVATTADGDFVVSWTGNAQDGSGAGVFARLFSSAGTPLASEFRVNDYVDNDQYGPSVTVSASGDFVVAWQSSGQDSPHTGIFARRFSSAGTPLAGEFRVNDHVDTDQYNPAVATAADGDFVVAWQSYLQDGSAMGIFARSFSREGSPLATELQVNSYTSGVQSLPSVATAADGDFVVAWQSFGQDGSSEGVFAQRFAPPRVLDIDGDGSVGALTDGLLVLRYLFGFTDSTLVAGAVGGDCTRCDAGAIETYLATLI